MKIAAPVLVSLLVLSPACQKSCAKKPSPTPAKQASALKPEEGGSYLKWIVKLSGEAIETVELVRIDSAFKLTPQPVGDHVVLVWQGEKQTAAFPFYFPSEIHLEGVNEQGHPVSETVPMQGDRQTHIWIPLEGPTDKLSIMNPSGQIVLETTTSSDGTPLSSLRPAPKKEGTLFKFLPRAFAQASPHGVFAAHVQVYGLHIPWGPLPPELNAYIERVYDPPEEAWVRQVAQEMLEAAPPTLSSLTHLGFVRVPPPRSASLCACTFGSIMLINVPQMNNPNCTGTVIHELAHSYDNLLSLSSIAAYGRGSVEQWPPQVREMAQRTIDRLGLRLYQYFRGLWEEIHNQARRYNLTLPYQGENWIGMTPENAIHNGFARNYGAKNPAEDIATFVEKVQGAAIQPGRPAVCEALQRASRHRDVERLFPSILPYIKIVLLKNAGFLTEEKIQACYGDFTIRGDRGIHFYKEDLRRPHIRFTSDLKAGFQTEQDVHFFSILGSGPNTYRVLVQVRAQDAQGQKKIPLGLHRLGNLGPFTIQLRGNNGVYLEHSENLKSRASHSGLVLISEYVIDPPHVEGAVFFLALRGALGSMPITPMGLPLPPIPGDPGRVTDFFPLVTFRYDR